MNIDDIAASIRDHRLSLQAAPKEATIITKDSHGDVHLALTKEGLAAWHMSMCEVTRDTESPWEFSCQRGHQHKHLHHAVASFAAFAYHQYVEHLLQSDMLKRLIPDLAEQVKIIRELFIKTKGTQTEAEASDEHNAEKSSLPAKRKSIYTTDKDCYFFYLENKTAHQIRIYLTVQRGVANTYSCSMQTIAHQFSFDDHVPELADIKRALQDGIYEHMRV